MSQQNLDFNSEHLARDFNDAAEYDRASFANQDFTYPQFGSSELGISPKNHTSYINPANLAVHPELLRIYGGNGKRLDLQSDIECNGIIVPLVASTRTSIITIVSGSCRNACAKALGMDSIPVVCYKFPSLEAEKHFILSANRNRPKTKYQQLLEGKEWELLEQEAAALRRREGLKQRWENKDGDDFHNHDYYPPTLLADYRSATIVAHQSNQKQRTTDKVGSRIGMSGKTYERAKPIVEKCEKLRQLGKESSAVALETYLESESIHAASNLLKSAKCDEVLSLVATGEAKTVKEALVLVGRIQRMSAVAEGAVFFFPDKILRKPTYFHLGRVVKIANMTATVCFRDSSDYDLHEHQYKCDELLSLARESEEPSQVKLRDRMNYLLSHESATPNDRYMLSRLLGAVTSVPNDVDYLEIIESRIASAPNQIEVEA